jgi:tetratricopeptide (TPR) repeat protein
MRGYWFRRRKNDDSDRDGHGGSPEFTDQEPRLEIGPDGRPTPASMAELRPAAQRGHVVSMANFGVALHIVGDRPGALRWLSRAWDAGNAAAGFNLGVLYEQAGDSNRAQVVWERSALLGDPDSMLYLVRQALARDDADAAARWAEPIHAQDAAFPITALGVAYRSHGDEAEAVRAFLRAEELGDAYAMEYRAQILAARGEFAEAAELLARSASAHRMR